jgi:hypothetical protein
MNKQFKSVADGNREVRERYNTTLHTYDMFPVGTPVRIICRMQDFTAFNGEETGVVVKSEPGHLGIIVKFDKPYDRFHEKFNFDAHDLVFYKKPNAINTRTESWRTLAETILESLAERNVYIVADMLQHRMEVMGLGLSDYSVLGGVFKRAAKSGIIERLDRPTKQALWLSKIYKDDNNA